MLGELGLTITANKALAEAYAIGREGNLLEKAEQKRGAMQGIHFELSSVWDGEKLLDALTNIFAQYQIQARDATFTMTPTNNMEISKETVGQRVDVAALSAQVEKLNIDQPENEIRVSFQEEPPKLTAAILDKEKITGFLAGYTTYFDPFQTARTENVRLAAAALDGAVIAPGDTFRLINKWANER